MKITTKYLFALVFCIVIAFTTQTLNKFRDAIQLEMLRREATKSKVTTQTLKALFNTKERFKILKSKYPGVKDTVVQAIAHSKRGLLVLNKAVSAGQSRIYIQMMKDDQIPEFCWKKSGFGDLASVCPPGYTRYHKLFCIKDCELNWSAIFGMCWQDCENGYSDHGLTCFKNIFTWYTKNARLTDIITAFSSRVECARGQYRFGIFCYDDCNYHGMVNCGLACAKTPELCRTQIIKMVADVASAMAQTTALILSAGSSASLVAAKMTFKKMISQVATKNILINTLKRAAEKFKLTFFRNKAKITEFIKNITIKEAKRVWGPQIIKFGKYLASKYDMNRFLDELVQPFVEASIQSLSTGDNEFTNEAVFEKLTTFVDFVSIKGLLTNCNLIEEEDKNKKDKDKDKKENEEEKKKKKYSNLQCAKAMLTTISTFDPTGIITAFTNFMHDTCNIDEKDTKDLNKLAEDHFNNNHNGLNQADPTEEEMKHFELETDDAKRCTILMQNCRKSGQAHEGREIKLCQQHLNRDIMLEDLLEPGEKFKINGVSVSPYHKIKLFGRIARPQGVTTREMNLDRNQEVLCLWDMQIRDTVFKVHLSEAEDNDSLEDATSKVLEEDDVAIGNMISVVSGQR